MARAEDGDYWEYEERYAKTAAQDGVEPDWEQFQVLWDQREESDEAMAELLAWVMGIDYEDALAWVEGRDTP